MSEIQSMIAVCARAQGGDDDELNSVCMCRLTTHDRCVHHSMKQNVDDKILLPSAVSKLIHSALLIISNNDILSSSLTTANNVPT
jgi:hypothetical protein